MLYVLPVYKGSRHSLPICLESIRIADDDPIIHLVDDKSNPIGKEFGDTLAKYYEGKFPVKYRLSEFDRKVNLNGKECILGLLSEFGKSMRMEDAGNVIKLDPDTLVLNITPLKKHTYKHLVGFEAESLFQMAGICYMVDRTFVRDATHLLNTRVTLDKKLPEDYTQSLIGCYLYGQDGIFLPPYVNDNDIAYTLGIKRIDPQMVERYTAIIKNNKDTMVAVHCGQGELRKELSKAFGITSEYVDGWVAEMILTNIGVDYKPAV